jgi:hypothetical protein
LVSLYCGRWDGLFEDQIDPGSLLPVVTNCFFHSNASDFGRDKKTENSMNHRCGRYIVEARM